MLHRVGWKRLLLGLLLGVVSVWLISAVGRDSHPDLEFLLFPGALFAAIVSPEGVHGPVPWLWVPAILFGNSVFYGALWVSLLVLLSARRRGAERTRSTT